METDTVTTEQKIELLKILGQMCFYNTGNDLKNLVDKIQNKTIEIIDSIKV